MAWLKANGQWQHMGNQHAIVCMKMSVLACCHDWRIALFNKGQFSWWHFSPEYNPSYWKPYIHVYSLISLIQLLYILLTLKLHSEMAHPLCSQTNLSLVHAFINIQKLWMHDSCSCHIALHRVFLHAHMCMWHCMTCLTRRNTSNGSILSVNVVAAASWVTQNICSA